MFFFAPHDYGPEIETCPGCTTRTVVGEDRIVFSSFRIEANTMTPIHSHHEDQMGLILEGVFERNQGQEIRVLRQGDVFFTPGGIEQGGRALDGPCRNLDVFCPPRPIYME